MTRTDDDLLNIPASAVLRYSSAFLLERLRSSNVDSIAHLSTADRTLILLGIEPRFWTLGGLHGYFMMEEANSAPERAQAMRRVGLLRYAETFERAIAAFGAPYPRNATERQARYGVFAHADGAPTPLDAELTDLSESFGSIDAYDRDLDAAIARSPDLASRLPVWREGLTDVGRLDYLIERLEARAGDDGRLDEAGLGECAEIYRRIFMASRLSGPAQNPILRLLQGPDGDLAPEVALALDAIGAGRSAALLKRAIASFGPLYPGDIKARLARLAERDRNGVLGNSETSREILALDAAFPVGEAVEAMVGLARAHGLLPR